jgi:inosose dehydratase
VRHVGNMPHACRPPYPAHSVCRCAYSYHDRVFDMHFKDVTEATAKGKCIQFGRGVIDVPALIRALVNVGYQGTAAYEYEAEEKDPLPGLCECVGYTKGVLASL